mgnify:CR=1 FL=1
MSHACRLRLPDGSKAVFFLGAAVTDNLVGRVWVAEIDRIKNQNLHTVVMGKGLQIRVRGRVQGVGFRPFIWREASTLGLVGDVRNDGEGVLIRVSGEAGSLLVDAIRESAPPLSEIHAIEVTEINSAPTDKFEILVSEDRGAETSCPPDAAICADCIDEINQSGRRSGYAFTNCTNCGPRFTIVERIPYDRERTTMQHFQMCGNCRAEFEDHVDRRFHAQPIACPQCGPSLTIKPEDPHPLDAAAARIRKGEIVAIKGLGGFHLACDATNATAVKSLRQRKRRPSKPFALMGELKTIRQFAQVSESETTLLTGPDAPIVLLEPTAKPLPEAVAPGMSRHGWMLPYTPLHWLLAKKVERPLIMTSGNASDEPQIVDNDEALAGLAHIADSFLIHDRPIARRVDDSVVQATTLAPMVLRRARGQTPGTLALPACLPDLQVAAYGAELKSAICLTKNARAMLSHHIGDLDTVLAYQDFLTVDRDLAALMAHEPSLIAVDSHPGYLSSRYGRELAELTRLPCLEIQHHHAHMAAALGAKGWDGDTAVSIVLDGLGFGDDGAIWGGEVLVGNYQSFRRAGHLTYAPLVGGDRAQREPWRNALVRLDAAGLSSTAERLFQEYPVSQIRAAAGLTSHAPLTSSVGRLFDAISACLGIVVGEQSHEGEAAMRLEALASRSDDRGFYELSCIKGVIDPAQMFEGLVADLAKGESEAVIARRCHGTIAKAFSDLARRVAAEAGAETIALSGGCFQNSLLLTMVAEHLHNFELCGPGQVPVNDGGIAFGQSLVALAQTA